MFKSPRDEVVTLEDLSMAIANRIGIAEDEASRNALFVMDIFGFDDRVIDNVLEPEDRQLFYMLEEEGMLTTEREETTLYDGREWRTHYWLFKKNAIKTMSENEREMRRLKRAVPSEEDVYHALPEELWGQRTL
jgi:DNA-binding transcriptional regulator PaaX